MDSPGSGGGVSGSMGAKVVRMDSVSGQPMTPRTSPRLVSTNTREQSDAMQHSCEKISTFASLWAHALGRLTSLGLFLDIRAKYTVDPGDCQGIGADALQLTIRIEHRFV